MEPASSFPFKSTRKLLEENIGKPIIEHKREFKLTRQFPSRVYKLKPNSDVAPSQISNKSSNMGELPINKLNKIRIRTQDGKDLGEFKLKLLPPDLMNKTIISNNVHLTSNTNMPITLLLENSAKLKNASQTLDIAPANNQLFLNINKKKSNLTKLQKVLVNDAQRVSSDNLDKDVNNSIFLQNGNQYSKLRNNEIVNNKVPQYKIPEQKNEVLIPMNKLSSNHKVTKRKAGADNIVTKRKAHFDNAIKKKNTSINNVVVKRKPIQNDAIIQKIANLDIIEESTLKENGVEMPFMKINILRKPKIKVSLGKNSVPIIYDPQKSIPKVCSPEKSISKVCSPEKTISKVCRPKKPIFKVCSPEKSMSKDCIPEKSISKLCISDKSISKDYTSEEVFSRKLIVKDCIPEKLISKDCVPENSLPSEVTESKKSVSKCNTQKRPKIDRITAEEPAVVVHTSEKCTLKLKEYQSLIHSKFPLVACKKLVIPEAKFDRNKSNSSVVQNTPLVKGNKSDQCSNIEMDCEILTVKNATIQNETQPGLNVKGTVITETACHTQKKNCSNVSVSNDTNITLYNSDDKVCSGMESETIGLCSKNTDNSTNDTKKVASDKKKQQKLLEHWDIITEALISVKDEELRAKALQALADCGIGIEQHVPITPPQNLKTVHDSQIQTDVFGLLEEENFILVKEDVPTLERIKQTEQSVRTFSIGSNSQSADTQSVQFNNKNSRLHKCTLNQEEIREINNILSQNCHDNARKVEQILSEPSYLMCSKISMQLKHDFEALKEQDEGGLLCIHRAVISNKLHEVKRLLLVLKACRMDIDVLTRDDKTCLELAVQTNASEAIVTVLLEAGAAPVKSQPLHESAVILACKTSSPLLPILLQYVKDHKLLNKVDSSGFAPLHYCALYGNLEGVNALLKSRINVNLQDNRSGRTPIFHAIENNHITIAHKLLVHGAIANILNFAGQSVTTLVEETRSLSLRTAVCGN